MHFAFLPREEIGKITGKTSHEYNNRLESHQSMCEEHREFMKEKKGQNQSGITYLHSLPPV